MVTRRLGVFVPVLLLLVIMINAKSVSAQRDDAAEEITLAKRQILVCLNTAVETARFGADVSSLVIILNNAGNLLSKAELAYSQGNFGAAVVNAVACSESLDGFVDEAAELQILEQEHGVYSLYGVIGSFLGVFIVIIVSYWVWILLKQRYGDVKLQNVNL